MVKGVNSCSSKRWANPPLRILQRASFLTITALGTSSSLRDRFQHDTMPQSTGDYINSIARRTDQLLKSGSGTNLFTAPSPVLRNLHGTLDRGRGHGVSSRRCKKWSVWANDETGQGSLSRLCDEAPLERRIRGGVSVLLSLVPTSMTESLKKPFATKEAR